MKVEIQKFESGWQSLMLGLTTNEIDELISELQHLKVSQEHFHYRSSFEGAPSIADIQVYYQTEQLEPDLVLDTSNANYVRSST